MEVNEEYPQYIIFGGKPRSRSYAKGHADASIPPALPHEPHVPTVGLAGEEVHVEVGEVHSLS